MQKSSKIALNINSTSSYENGSNFIECTKKSEALCTTTGNMKFYQPPPTSSIDSQVINKISTVYKSQLVDI
jgi:hypothetical protein